MKTKGIITKIFEEKKFFFIDNDYFCRYDWIDFIPAVGDNVIYEKSTNRDGKPEAKNVKKFAGIFEEYLEKLSEGYFIKDDFIKNEFVLDFAKGLASEFTKNEDVNKPTQIRKYFDYCDKIYGVYKVKRNFLYVQSELPKLMAHLNSALKKGLISKDFFTFMDRNIELALAGEKNFTKGFIPHFEAVIGFSQK
jgi:CRISPR/Cas system CSM-associated protein Csm2 small subunit